MMMKAAVLEWIDVTVKPVLFMVVLMMAIFLMLQIKAMASPLGPAPSQTATPTVIRIAEDEDECDPDEGDEDDGDEDDGFCGDIPVDG